MTKYSFEFKMKAITDTTEWTCVMVNFFGILKQKMYHGSKYYNYEKLKDAIEQYIDYYNKKRIKVNLRRMGPVQYRLTLQSA